MVNASQTDTPLVVSESVRVAILSAFRRIYTPCDHLLEQPEALPKQEAFERYVALMINHSHYTVADIEGVARRAEQLYLTLRDIPGQNRISPLAECGYWASAFLSNPLAAGFDNLTAIECLQRAYCIARDNNLFVAQFSLAGQLAMRTCVEGYAMEAMRLMSGVLRQIRSLPQASSGRDEMLVLALRDSARIQHDSGRFSAAIDFLECAVNLLGETNSPVRAQIYLMIAQCQTQLGKVARAREAMVAVANELREFGNDRMLMAIATRVDMETSLIADQMISAATDKLEQTQSNRQYAGSWNLTLALVNTYVRLGRYREALSLLKEAQARTVVPLFQLQLAKLKAKCLTELGEICAAIEALKPTLKIAARRHASPDFMGLMKEFATTNLPLQKTNEMLEELEHERRQMLLTSYLVGAVGHDLQAPLTVLNLVGFNQDYCDEALEAIQTINTLMNSLWSIEAPAPELFNLRATSLLSAIEEVVQRYRVVTRAQSIQLEVDCPEQIHCQAQRSSLIRILDNLLSNAIKYSSSGCLVELKVIAISDRLVGITVRDQGVGFTKDKIATIFERGGTIPQKLEGAKVQSGYGMYIAQKLAISMSGSLSAYSKGLNQGATFTLILQRALVSPD